MTQQFILTRHQVGSYVKERQMFAPLFMLFSWAYLSPNLTLVSEETIVDEETGDEDEHLTLRASFGPLSEQITIVNCPENLRETLLRKARS